MAAALTGTLAKELKYAWVYEVVFSGAGVGVVVVRQR